MRAKLEDKTPSAGPDHISAAAQDSAGQSLPLDSSSREPFQAQETLDCHSDTVRCHMSLARGKILLMKREEAIDQNVFILVIALMKYVIPEPHTTKPCRCLLS